MFNPKNKAEQAVGSLNTIGAGTAVEGNINSKGDLRIDGTINGNLVSTSRVVIGSKAVVVGNINAANAIIEGKVNGNVSVDAVLYLKGTAIIEGDIEMQKLMVENGAIFNGKSNMTSGPVSNELSDGSKT